MAPLTNAQFVAAAIAAAKASVPASVPALRPVTVAQAILESGYGRSGLSTRYHNYFGIKAGTSWTGPVAALDTLEVLRGQTVKQSAAWRVYASMGESFADHAALFQRLRLTYRGALSHPNDPVAFAHALTGVYATDPLYGTKLVRIMAEHSLLQAFGFSGPGALAALPRTPYPLGVVAALVLGAAWVTGRVHA